PRALVRLNAPLVGKGQNHRLTVENFLEPLVKAGHNPALPEIVIHDKESAWFEPPAHVLERLAGEKVTLQSDVAVAAVEHERIDEGVDDQVILAVGGMQEVAADRQYD